VRVIELVDDGIEDAEQPGVVISVEIFDSVFLPVIISHKNDNSTKYSHVGNFVHAQPEHVILSLF
jgi:hypothetical protein